MSRNDNDVIEVVGTPWVPPGEYVVRLLRYELTYIFNTAKVFIHFEIVEGEYSGIRLYAAYRVLEIKRKTKNGGKFSLRKSHKLYRQLAKLRNSSMRTDRPSLNGLKNCLLRVRVVTVTGSPHDPLPEAAHYSRVDELLSVEAGSAT